MNKNTRALMAARVALLVALVTAWPDAVTAEDTPSSTPAPDTEAGKDVDETGAGLAVGGRF